MQIMLYVHTQFGRKIGGKLYWGNYHKITALKVVSRVSPTEMWKIYFFLSGKHSRPLRQTSEN